MQVPPEDKISQDTANEEEDDDDTELMTHQLPPHDPSPWNRMVGAFVITTVLGCMALGPLLPLLLIGYAILYPDSLHLVVTLTVALITSMILSRHSPPWCRWHLLSAGYFTGGVFLHAERRTVRAVTGSDGSMWCMHPHGTSLGFGFALNGAVRFRADRDARYVPAWFAQSVPRRRLRNANGVMAPILFWIPLIRNMLLALGCCTPATKSAMKALLSGRVDFGILPGGMEEVALYEHGREQVYLSKRAGFIKYALQHGYLLQPAYTFGECDLYHSVTAGAPARLWVQKHGGFIVPIFWGPYWWCGLPWLPRSDVALHTVLGSPLQLPHVDDPTPQQVQTYHQLYVRSLAQVFDTHKDRFGYGNRQLHIL